eukprot:Amastigsp_a510548_37.p3 type:complete len:107 gc:universal Amastigsp_a510548_37:346-26(-)
MRNATFDRHVLGRRALESTLAHKVVAFSLFVRELNVKLGQHKTITKRAFATLRCHRKRSKLAPQRDVSPPVIEQPLASEHVHCKRSHCSVQQRESCGRSHRCVCKL